MVLAVATILLRKTTQLVSAQAFRWIDEIESELNKCINMNVIKDKKNRVECRYFKTTYVNQKSMIQNTKDLYLQGKGSLALWASAVGIARSILRTARQGTRR